MSARDDRLAVAMLVAIILVFIGFFSLYQIQRHRTFQTYIDLTNVEQIIWNTLHGRFLHITTHPTTGEIIRDFSSRATENLLADHVQPILLLLALPYALLPRPETLSVVMCVAVALGAIPMYRLARRRLQNPWWALLFAAGYLLLPALETNSGWDIHGANFLPPLLLAGLDAAQSGKRGRWWVCALLAMSCREDMPFLVGWAFFWLAPREQRREAGLMLGLGLLWSLLNFLVIIPHFAGGAGTPYLVRFFPPGTEMTPAGLLAVLLQFDFWRSTLAHFLGYNVRLGIPVLFLYLLHRPSLLAMLPTLLLNGFSWFQAARIPSYSHYSAAIVPWLLVGALEGFIALERWLQQRRPAIRWRGLLAEGLVVALLAAHFLDGYTFINPNFVWPQPTGQETAIEQVLAQIPADAPLSAEMHLSAHLAQRETLRIFPDMRDAEWLVVNAWFGGDPYGRSSQVWREVAQSTTWKTVAARDGLFLLRKSEGDSPRDLAQAFRFSEGMSFDALQLRFGSEQQGLDLRGYALYPLPYGHFVFCSRWTLQGDVPITPKIGVEASPPGNITFNDLDVLKYVPDIFSKPGDVQDCTAFQVLQGDDVVLRLIGRDLQGQDYPAQILAACGADVTLMSDEMSIILRASMSLR